VLAVVGFVHTLRQTVRGAISGGLVIGLDVGVTFGIIGIWRRQSNSVSANAVGNNVISKRSSLSPEPRNLRDQLAGWYAPTQSTFIVWGKVVVESGAPGQVPPTATFRMK
jgi:hypothetical protein